MTKWTNPVSNPGPCTYSGAWHSGFNPTGGFIFGDNSKGLIAACTILTVWAASLVCGLSLDLSRLSPGVILLAMAWQTFLYTGLFITAHDAMHGLVVPRNRKVNDRIGSLAVRLYALFSYRNLLAKHWQHHRHPASPQDPDFHDGAHDGFIRWYLRFITHYLTWKQLAGMALLFNALVYIAGIPWRNLALFWAAPAILSTFQLFYFGTFLPHREGPEPYRDAHRARSNNYPVFWSFLTCYHFGYHWEHHEFPNVAWWHLPAVRRHSLREQ